MTLNRKFVLDNRPKTAASADNFRMIEETLPALQDGQVLIRHHYPSLDPYMRGRMNDTKSYAQPQALGQVMIGGTVGEVVESRCDKFRVGDHVVGMGGWQLYSIVDGHLPGAIRKVDTRQVPISHYLGAVGSAFGALAKARGCRVVGIAGGQEKCDYVVNTLGFDACIDYKQHADAVSLSRALHAACPNGIDGHFENVGGKVLDAVMLRTNAFARIAVCGMIAGYDGVPLPMAYPALILVNRLKVEGFIVSEHMDVWPAALQELGQLVGSGQFRPRETVAEGLDSAPEAFLGLLKGRNFGKQLVKLI